MIDNIQYKTDSDDISTIQKNDNFEIKVDASNIEKLPNGSIRFPASITRSGIFPYRDQKTGKIYQQLRSPEEVFKPDSIATLRTAPITSEHPDEHQINTSNYKKYAKGALSDVITQNNDTLDTFITINDAQLIEDILSGKRQEISCGYHCQEMDQSGEYQGVKYDSIQKNIIYNHVAVVKRGRAGRNIRIKMDDGYHIDSYEEIENIKSQEEKLKTMKIKGKEIKVDEMGEFLIEAQLKEDSDRIAELELNLKASNESVLELKIKADKLDISDANLIKAQSDIETMKVKFDESVSEHVAVTVKAKSYLKNDADLSGLSVQDIKKQIVIQAFPNKDFSEKKDGFFDALFETLDDVPEAKLEVKKDSGRDLFGKSKVNNSVTKNDSYETLLAAYSKKKVTI